MKNKLIALALFGLSQSVLAASLPTTSVGPFEFKDKPVTEALREMFANTGIEVVPNNLPNIIISASGVQGSLPVVMDALAQHAGLTYMYNENMIVVSQAKNSTVNIPVAPRTEEATRVPTLAPAAAVVTSPVAEIKPVAPVVAKQEVKPTPAPAPAPAPAPVLAPVAEVKPAAEVAVAAKPEVPVKRKALNLNKPKVEEIAPVEQAKPLVALADAAVPPVAETKLESAPKEKGAQTYHLKLASGSGVKRLIESSARANGYTLNWDGDDLYVKYDASFTDTTYEGLLNQVLSSIKVNGYMTNNATNGRVIYVITK